MKLKYPLPLTGHVTEEWRSQSINYEDLKAALYDVLEQSPDAEKTDAQTLRDYFSAADEEFFAFCERELLKVNTFFAEKIANCRRKLRDLEHEIATAHGRELIEKPSFYPRDEPKEPNPSQLRRLRRHVSEYHLILVLLQNYQSLNYIAFRKILKKHDKLFKSNSGERWLSNVLNFAPFYLNNDVDRLIEETERITAVNLEQGNQTKATRRLHVPPMKACQSLWTTFLLGQFSGIFLAEIGLIIFFGFMKVPSTEWPTVTHLYRGTFLVIVLIFLCGLNIYGWRRSGINYVLIFELDPHEHLAERHVMQIAAAMGVVWSSSLLAFVFHEALNIPAYAAPLLMLFVMFSFLFNPSKTLYYDTRFWILRSLGRICLAPLFPVKYIDFFLAEQLLSLFPVFIDMQYFTCFFVSNTEWTEHNYSSANATGSRDCLNAVIFTKPLLACLPFWFRFAQCLRRYHDSKRIIHAFNAAKYALVCFVINCAYWNVKVRVGLEPNIFFVFLLLTSLMCGCFTCLWDIRADWGLFNEIENKRKYLRNQTIYPREGYYYVAVALNFFLRIPWAVCLSLPELTFVEGDQIMSILAPLEVFRRFIWNFFGLENEHLTNFEKFREVDDIAVTPLPIDSGAQDELVRMMDYDMVTNRSNATKFHHNLRFRVKKEN